jgi:hypothetical protein
LRIRNTLNIVYGARGERHGKAGTKTGDLFRRPGCATHRLAQRKHAGEQAYGLEKFEFVTAVEQRLV